MTALPTNGINKEYLETLKYDELLGTLMAITNITDYDSNTSSSSDIPFKIKCHSPFRQSQINQKINQI